MVLKIKSIPSFERRDHIESKYIVINGFWFFQNIKKGRKTENLAENDFKWPLRSKLTSDKKITVSSDSLAQKPIENGGIYYSDPPGSYTNIYVIYLWGQGIQWDSYLCDKRSTLTSKVI